MGKEDAHVSKTSLSAFFLFHGLDAAAEQAIADRLEPTVCYRRGQAVYGAHRFRRAIGLIESGCVIVRSVNDRVVINRLSAGDMFGVAALFDENADDYVTEIIADSDTRIRFIPQALMTQLLTEWPIVAENYIRFLSGRIRFLNRKLSALTVGDTESRLYHYLLTRQDEQGNVHLSGTMTELAHALNMGRSSLYRALDTLTQEGLLEKSGSSYRIQKEGLL